MGSPQPIVRLTLFGVELRLILEGVPGPPPVATSRSDLEGVPGRDDGRDMMHGLVGVSVGAVSDECGEAGVHNTASSASVDWLEGGLDRLTSL